MVSQWGPTAGDLAVSIVEDWQVLLFVGIADNADIAKGIIGYLQGKAEKEAK